MPRIRRSLLDADTLLASYATNGNYTDCYETQVPGNVTLKAYIDAFYTTWLFRIERRLLGWFARRPADDRDVRRLAAGETDDFSAWHVERRRGHEILLCDLQGATRSWLMVAPATDGMPATTLRFGSAVVAHDGELGRAFRLLLGFHKLYSRALLSATRRKLARNA